MQRTSLEALRQVLDGELLVLERGAVLVVQPTELLQDLRMVGVLLHYPLVSVAGTHMLQPDRRQCQAGARTLAKNTHVALLLEDVSDLEPDVGMCEGAGGITQDAIKALEALLVFALLLINNPEAEQDLVRLVEI